MRTTDGRPPDPTKPQAAEAQVEANKRLEKAELEKGAFKFELKDSKGNVVRRAENGADGKVIFDKLSFGKAGTYTYTLYEVTGNAEGITYDKTVYTVEIVVTDDGEGKLDAAEPVYKKMGSDKALEEVTFVNTYLPPNIPQTGDRRHLDMWFMLLFVSGLGIAVTSPFGKKKYAKKRVN